MLLWDGVAWTLRWQVCELDPVLLYWNGDTVGGGNGGDGGGINSDDDYRTV